MLCRICNSKKIKTFLNLGKHPWCNNFLKKKQLGKEKKYPLILVFCKNCSLVQLNYTVKKEIMFSDHTYLSGTTKTLSNHFLKVANKLEKKNRYNKSNILDLGSNDGTFLKHFKKKGWQVLGIEPSKRISKIANKSKIKTINKFFDYDLAKKINKKFRFINAAGVFFHLEELHSFTKGVKYLLHDKGTFVVQFLYMKKIVENTAFDQIYHEHLLYYNLLTLQNLLDFYDLEIYDCDLMNVHGGQMVAFVGHKGFNKKTKKYKNFLSLEKRSKCNSFKYYENFRKKIFKLKYKNQLFFKKMQRQNKLIYGIGAPAKGNTLLNFFNISNQNIKKILEKNKMRKNLFTPGTHIPIVMEDEEKSIPDIYYVLAWNFKQEILKNFKKKINKNVKFYFPINI